MRIRYLKLYELCKNETLKSKICTTLGVTPAELNKKFDGRDDFTLLEGRIISDIIGEPLSKIFN